MINHSRSAMETPLLETPLLVLFSYYFLVEPNFHGPEIFLKILCNAFSICDVICYFFFFFVFLISLKIVGKSAL